MRVTPGVLYSRPLRAYSIVQRLSVRCYTPYQGILTLIDITNVPAYRNRTDRVGLHETFA